MIQTSIALASSSTKIPDTPIYSAGHYVYQDSHATDELHLFLLATPLLTLPHNTTYSYGHALKYPSYHNEHSFTQLTWSLLQ